MFVQGWPSTNNTWEIATSLSCPDVLKKYQAKQKSELNSSKTPKSPTKSATKAEKKSMTPTKKSKATNKKSKSAKESKAAKSKKKIVEDEDNDEQDWEVEKIIDVRYNDDGTKEFQIRWKGCDSSQDTWEPESNVNSPDLVHAFMNKTDADDVVAPKKKSRKA